MAIIYDFSNQNNWSLTWSGVKVAPDVSSESLNKYFPIEDFAIPVQFSSPIISIYLVSDSDPGRWIKGGWAKQKIVTGITGGGSPDAYTQIIPLKLRQINICQFSQTVTSFAVVLSIPYWLRHIDITVWEYTGEITDTLEQKLDECCQSLETNIDNIHQDLAYATVTILNKIEDSQGGGGGGDSENRSSGQNVAISYFMGLL